MVWYTHDEIVHPHSPYVHISYSVRPRCCSFNSNGQCESLEKRKSKVQTLTLLFLYINANAGESGSIELTMRKFLKYTPILLITIFCHQLVKGANTYDFKIDNLAYKILIEGYSVEISEGSSGIDIVIPSEISYNGYKYIVTQIGNRAFHRTKLKSISIPESVTAINDYAFAYSPIASISIPSSVKSFGENIFTSCDSLSNVDLPEGMISIGNSMFSECKSLKEITLPNSLVTIGKSAFEKCTSLSNIQLPNSLVKINDLAFKGCKSLHNIKFPTRLNYIGKQSFSECSSFTEVIIPKNIMTLGGTTTDGGSRTFGNCENLKSIIIEDSDEPLAIYGNYYENESIYGDTRYRYQEFSGCPIESVYVGRDFTGYQSHAVFAFASSLRYLTVRQMTSSLYLKLTGIEKLYLGDGVMKMPDCRECESLTDVYIGKNISNISGSDFGSYCRKLQNLYIFSDGVSIKNTSAGFPNHSIRIYCKDPNTSSFQGPTFDCSLHYLITLDPLNIEYSGKTPEFTYKNNVEGAKVSFDSPNININAGSYNTGIDVTFSINNWHSTANVPGSYTITKAPLSIVAKNATRRYGEKNPEFNYTMTGFKNGETENVLNRKPTIMTTADSDSPAGSYLIVVSGGEAQNYSFSYVPGTLTIIKADQTITWEQNFERAKVGDSVELIASSSSGLPIKYVVTDESMADIFTQGGRKYVKFLKPGNFKIRAFQDGNENYNEADQISKTVSIRIDPTGLTLDSQNLKLDIGEYHTLKASIIPSDAEVPTIIWETNDESIVSVTQNGILTAKGKGTAVIKALLASHPSIFAECIVNVIQPVTLITLNHSYLELAIGQNVNITVSIEPQDASDKTVKWSSSDEKVAFVVDGAVYAIGAGSAVITAEAKDGSNVSTSCFVNVKSTSGVQDIIADEELISVYTVNGVPIAESILYKDINKLEPGLYIIKSANGVNKKIIIH